MLSIRHNWHSAMPLQWMALLPWLLVCLLSGSARAMQMPPWQQLVFEQKSFWATARGVLTLSEFTDARGARDLDSAQASDTQRSSGYLSLEVNNYVASNSEQITLTLDAATGAAQFRWRLSRGRDSRVKIHEYHDTLIARERREPPAGDDSVSPADWPATHEMNLPLPPQAEGRHIVATHALLVLLPTLLEDPSRADNYLVHTDLNFFRLEADLSDKIVTIGNTLTVDGERRRKDRRCQVLTLRLVPLPGNPEEPDVMLMGMSGKIHVFIDTATGLPLRLRGDAPRIGSAELNLIEASTRNTRNPAQRLRPSPPP
ncbi:hypothetical protein [Chromatocurvus halotolerans]|uniref:DUF3108 domain-containing protein n=1 Tax=Chromatocurvus halotolerans TaxID=1132028 RepID=A0A4V2SBN9_9GAMM|nr:hypothetical protein [Chromatocurvus halotolerans]TCO76260.1 hypothetical protein EV688_105223 [Chromatocurvus halotolerans]